MKKTLLLTCLAALPYLGYAQKLPLNKQQLLQDIKVLSADSMQGRLSGTMGSYMAQDYIIKRFQEIGLQPYNGSFKQHFRLESRRLTVEQATNLVGYIPGKSGKAVVLSAHYDHVGVHDGEVFNGTDDNASGVGALLAAAAYFKKNPPKHTIIFAAFDGEELGLQGANAFLENPPVNLDQIMLNVNLDMLSINQKGELYASGTYHYPQLLPCLKQVTARPKAKILIGHDHPDQGKDDWTKQSDHYQFHKRNIPYIYFGVEDHPHYHKPTDDFININPDFYVEASALVIDFLKIVDRVLPLGK